MNDQQQQQQQNNKSGGQSTTMANNNNQTSTFNKSMEDWLSNSNNNNINVNNHNNGNGNDANYQQKHLDDWLNATMKDSPKTFSISSTEFPNDGPTRNAQLNGMVLMPPINSMRPMPEFHVTTTIDFVCWRMELIFLSFLCSFPFHAEFSEPKQRLRK